ncbi:MAG TPA: trypsin-like peptidase domain-containing protein [Xanthobacteraceae bacterium]|nr:trypsin-like peptidase domain-containing protein [Xanthobacteraceae bacterium]
MAVNPEMRIIIRHLSGSKINQVEQIPLKDLHEVTIGRDPNASIAYDQRRDDVVSREHALIRVEAGERLSFRLLDLKSSNGTLLNGELISGEVELVPEDIIELGRGGPKFTFDVKPRPDNLTSRTRLIDAIDASATRAMATVTAAGTKEMATAANAGAKEPATAAVRTRDGDGPAKVAVGKDTVLRMLSQERRSTSRVWMSSLAAVLVVLAVGGIGLYWHNTAIAKRLQDEAAQKGQELLASASTSVSQQLGLMAKDIHDKFENTTVYIEVQWRLYDKGTGKPLFHKVFLNDKNESIPAFVKLPNGAVVRWLTLEDENRKNLPIMDSVSGSGFVVGEQGFIFTNKHVAAGWMLPYSDIGQGPKNPSRIGLVFPYRMQFPKNKQEKKDFLKNEFVRSLNSDELSALQNWVPEEGALVFDPGSATYIGGDVDNRRVFIGRNEVLDVRFPGNRMSMASSLVRASTDADVALIKVEAAQGLKVAELSQDDKLEVGEKVIVLGYPGVSEKTYIVMETRENGRSSRRQELVPEPTVTEGIISRLGSAVRKEGQATVVGTVEDAFQLSVNATGAGNSGGPVFNTKGQVIGLFTYGRNYGGASVSFAVPISHGRALLQPQRTD